MIRILNLITSSCGVFDAVGTFYNDDDDDDDDNNNNNNNNNNNK
jgi:hypothetical protein